MSKMKMHILALLLSAVMLLSGCRQEVDPGITQTLFWTAWPQVNYGAMEYEKLTVQPWYSGRCEATSENCFAETALGYYASFDGILYYADKADLSTWVAACDRPDCSHSAAAADCSASAGWGSFVIKDGRVFILDLLDRHPELYQTEASGFAVYSRALDSNDIRLEYVNENMFSYGGSGFSQIFTDTHWICNIAKLNPDGSHCVQCYRVTKSGVELLVDQTIDDFVPATMWSPERKLSFMEGEPSFNHLLLGEIPYSECRYRDGQLYFTDLTGYYEDGRYLCGDTLRLFRKNDGYYDLDLNTRKEVRVGDSHIENGDSIVFLPNCILESTLFLGAYEQISGETTHSMVLFDGEAWREVQLPQELLTPGYDKYLVYRCVTSDSIFFTYQERVAVHLYRIPIQSGGLALEYCGRIK